MYETIKFVCVQASKRFETQHQATRAIEWLCVLVYMGDIAVVLYLYGRNLPKSVLI